MAMKRMAARGATAIAAGGTAVVVLGGGIAAAAIVMTAGPRSDGTAVTPVGFHVTPAGTQTRLGDLPLALAVSPQQNVVLASNDGQAEQSLQVVDPSTSKVLQTISYASPASLFEGLAFSPRGDYAYAAGGGDEQVHVYRVDGQHLTETTPLSLPTTDPSGNKINMYPAGIAVTPDGSRLVVADHLADAASVIDVATGTVQTVAVGHAPLDVAVSGDGRTAYVSDQGGSSVSVVDLTGGQPNVAATIPVGTHPNALALDNAGHRLFVADADSDQVSVVDTTARRVIHTISLSPYPGAQAGTNPLGLSLSPDGSELFVANSGNNDVDVVNVSSASYPVVGSIPTAWYPSSVAVAAGKLFVANAKGLGAGPNTGPGYPNPTSKTSTAADEYVGSMMVGTLSTIKLPLDQAQLERDTAKVSYDNGWRNEHGGRSGEPITHVIYIVRENRTYDQEFGSLGKGNGDASLNLFGDESAPNSRQLERNFVTLDNFYADAEISAQGWNWAVASNSNAYSEALWPADYSGRNAPYPSENGDPAIAPNTDPADAYIWDRLADKGVSFRNYGFYVSPNADHTALVAADPRLDANTDHSYLGFDLNCPSNPDTFSARGPECGLVPPRYVEWKREFDEYVANGDLPTVEFVRLPNDHTAGTKPGMPTPQAYVADNDLALGRIVDAVSHSKYWKNTAIFVTEDDAQNGPDHVDAHRTTAMVISPYTQTGKVDSTFYSTVSMIRTIEDIVGVKPMTQFDTFATPMSASFVTHAQTTPYRARRPAMAGDEANTASAPMASISAKQDLDKEDQIDMLLFNEAIWKSVKGADSTMPTPRHLLTAAKDGSTTSTRDSDG